MTIQDRFEEFHQNNPRVYLLLRLYALQMKSTGRVQYSINAIFERVRWHVDMETRDGTGFKLSNNHRSRYARLLMENEPKLAGFFTIRPLQSE